MHDLMIYRGGGDREAGDSAGVEKVVDASEDADHRRCEKYPWTHVLDGGSGQKGHMRTVLKRAPPSLSGFTTIIGMDICSYLTRGRNNQGNN
ncbi:hypothetical protein LXL04_016046 [Taraxacum kok-saghyz]